MRHTYSTTYVPHDLEDLREAGIPQARTICLRCGCERQEIRTVWRTTRKVYIRNGREYSASPECNK